MTSSPNADYVPPFRVGQRVRIREDLRRAGDFQEAVIANIDTDDGTIDVSVDGKDWGQWFYPLNDGSYAIEPAPNDSSDAQ